jgi:hypothetical protein
MLEFLTVIAVALIGLAIYHSKIGRPLRIAVLHALNEVGAPAEKRYKAAAKMLRLSQAGGESNHWGLHRALDVLLCEGIFERIPTDSRLHHGYWELGHRIANEILKQQEYLNIQAYWFADSYEAAKEELARR